MEVELVYELVIGDVVDDCVDVEDVYCDWYLGFG